MHSVVQKSQPIELWPVRASAVATAPSTPVSCIRRSHAAAQRDCGCPDFLHMHHVQAVVAMCCLESGARGYMTASATFPPAARMNFRYERWKLAFFRKVTPTHVTMAGLERWMSGLSRTPGKRVWVNSPPRVRIPPLPPVHDPK